MSLRLRSALAVALVASSLLAQQPLTESIEVRLLEIDVVVTDKAGNAVHGLTADDFELFDNGTRQQITNLSESIDDRAIAGATATAEEAAPRPSANVTPPEPRTIVILLDPMPLRGKPRVDFFASLRTLIERVQRDVDQVQILTWSGSGFRPNLELTTDRAKVTALLTEMGANPTAVMPAGMSIEQKEIFYKTIAEMGTGQGGSAFDPSSMDADKRAAAEEELAAMKRKTASMQRVVASLAGPKGKSVVIYASEQFGRIAGRRAFIGSRASAAPPTADETAHYDTTKLIESVVATANASGVAFYALRPVIPSTVGEMRTREEEIAIAGQLTGGTEATTDALLLQNEREALQQLAERTGGTLGIGPDGVQLAIQRIATDLTSSYTLGWHARSDGSDRVRRIRVKAKNPEYRVRTRATLVEKSDRSRAEELMTARLFERGGTGDLDFEVTVGPSKQGRRATRTIPVELKIPVDQLKFVDEGGVSAARFSVMTIAGSDIGDTTSLRRDTRRVTANGAATDEGVIRYTLDAVTDAARRTFSIGVFDESSGAIGVRTIDLEQGEGIVAAIDSPAADAAWREGLARAARDRKPLVLFFRPKRCKECDLFERDTVPHPAIGRRLESVVFTPVALVSGATSPLWKEKGAGIVLLDGSGTMRARWIGVPDTTALVSILDAAIASAPNFQRALQLSNSAGPYAGATEAAIGLSKLGRAKDAREVLTEAATKGDDESRQLAAVALATLDAREGRLDAALANLASLAADARTPHVAAEAWLATGLIQSARGALDDARRALRAAVETADAGSQTHASATALLARFEAAAATSGNAIRLVPLAHRVVKGRQRVQTIVTSASVAKVEFTLDGEKTATVTSPPFASEVQFGDVPQTRTVRVVAFNATGSEVGRDELRVNDAGEVFWVRFAEPAAGLAVGRVKVALDLRSPAGRQVKRIALSWNDAPVATIAAAPWTTDVDVPQGIGILRAVAELDDGRTAEDAVLLNAASAGERAEVQLVDLPVTLTPSKPFAPSDVTVREGRTKRVVESVTPAGAAPLTVGILIDWSASMRQWMPNLQEAALRFVESVVGPNDRAFVVAFHSEARLVQPPTSDRDLLRRTIMSLQLQPEAPTAVHDAMIFGLLQFEGVRGRRALIMFTDGLDQQSRYTADDLMTMSRRSNVPVYIVTPPLPMVSKVREAVAVPGRPAGVPDARPGVAMAPRMAQTVVSALDPRADKLYTVSNASGGKLFEVKNLDGLQKIYDSVAETLEAQALVTIRTDPATKENEWRAIEVRVEGAEVRTPAGYYGPR